MQRSRERILTTHVGSLARPHALLEQLQRKINDEPFDDAALARLTRQAVVDVVRQQAEAGVDIVSDGEQSKAGFYGYVAERLTGLTVADQPNIDDRSAWRAEIQAFPEYYAEYLGGKNRATVRNRPLVCSGPIAYQGQAVLQSDLANLRTALRDVDVSEAFVPSIAPRELGIDEFYGSAEDFLSAIAEAMRAEYVAIVEAGFILQIDDPWLTGYYAGEPHPIR
ncbi:MAG TPA: methionine synthase, partial [Chloroflexota bacterium]